MKKKKELNKFTIDFFELCFLAEACIPPVPIARHCFWDRFVDEIFYDLSWEQRERVFHWMKKTNAMEYGLKNNNEDCEIFMAKFDKNNWYKVHCSRDGINEIHEAYLYKGLYFIRKNTNIVSEYIIKVEKLDGV